MRITIHTINQDDTDVARGQNRAALAAGIDDARCVYAGPHEDAPAEFQLPDTVLEALLEPGDYIASIEAYGNGARNMFVRDVNAALYRYLIVRSDAHLLQKTARVGESVSYFIDCPYCHDEVVPVNDDYPYKGDRYCTHCQRTFAVMETSDGKQPPIKPPSGRNQRETVWLFPKNVSLARQALQRASGRAMLDN